jgi:hypothetical protein
MSDEPKRPAGPSAQRIVGALIFALGVLFLAEPFWFPGIKMTAAQMFQTPLPYIGLPIILLGLVVIRMATRQ